VPVQDLVEVEATEYEILSHDDQPVFAEFCQELFVSLARSDQRRWGEAYVRGLLQVSGRKSIRRISELVVGRDADQSLQQFVNQSPWAWAPVRRALAERVSQAMRPKAWVVREVVFPKNGDSSVGVARQYAPSAGRMLNCQRAVSVFLAGDEGSCPVNWRLVMPRAWDDDTQRRAKTRVPDDERSQPDWRYLVDSLDEMIENWGLPALPVVVDLNSDRDVEPLLRSFEERGLRYLARALPTMTALPAGPVSSAQSRPPTVGQVVASAAKRGRATLVRRDPATGELVPSHFVAAPVPGSTAPGDIRKSRVARTRYVVAEWEQGQPKPHAVWLTNLGGNGIVDIAGLLPARDHVRTDVGRLAEDSGLRHFEGRSFQGWHHHVTLASVAHGYRLVRKLDQQQFADEWLRPYA
jgi:hypothetical protein